MKKFKLSKFFKILIKLLFIIIWISLIVLTWQASRGFGATIHAQNIPVLLVIALPLLIVTAKDKYCEKNDDSDSNKTN